GISRDRLSCVPNAFSPRTGPIDRSVARRELSLDQGDLVAGWIGRLSAEKGPDILVDALADDACPRRLIVAVIGEGPERLHLEQRAAQLNVADRLRFCGALPDAARLFPAFDLVTISSRTEGTPMVLLEAMASSTPVVATRVGGIPDVVDEHRA